MLLFDGDGSECSQQFGNARWCIITCGEVEEVGDKVIQTDSDSLSTYHRVAHIQRGTSDRYRDIHVHNPYMYTLSVYM